MKESADLVAGWLKKAESDLLAAEATLNAAHSMLLFSRSASGGENS